MLWMLLAHDDVLDANAKFSLLVEARLVGDAHALDKLELVAATNSVGALVHIEE